MTLEEAIAKFNLGELGVSQFPKIAMAQLDNGIESESLIILAGMSDKNNLFEIKQYVDQVINELKIRSYESNNAAFILCNYYVQEFKNDKLNIIEAICKIKNECWENHSVEIISEKYVYDTIEFGRIIGNWYEYYDIDQHADWVRRSGKSIGQVKEEIEEELKNELLEWEQDFLTKKLREIKK